MFQLVKNFPHFRKSEDSLWHPQLPTSNPHPEPARTRPGPFILYPENPFFINFPLCLGPQLGSFPQVSPHKPYIQLSFLLYALHDTPYLILLVFFTQTILCEEYRSLSSSLCSFLRYLVISFHLDPNILLNNLSNTLSRRSYQISATMFQNHMKKQAKFYFCIS